MLLLILAAGAVILVATRAAASTPAGTAPSVPAAPPDEVRRPTEQDVLRAAAGGPVGAGVFIAKHTLLTKQGRKSTVAAGKAALTAPITVGAGLFGGKGPGIFESLPRIGVPVGPPATLVVDVPGGESPAAPAGYVQASAPSLSAPPAPRRETVER